MGKRNGQRRGSKKMAHRRGRLPPCIAERSGCIDSGEIRVFTFRDGKGTLPIAGHTDDAPTALFQNFGHADSSMQIAFDDQEPGVFKRGRTGGKAI